ncbi:MAG: hypothetical protein BA871_02235 [Desulfuromonadales bacterium C00003096]|nr:MAG: hypothetical protein BA871_02235 [Desulfuromonadales bacterium C00003096]
MGRLIPAGTGISKYRSAKLTIEEPEEILEPPMVEEIEEIEEIEAKEGLVEDASGSVEETE